MRSLKDLIRDKKAASAVEYGLILSLIFLAMLVGMQALGTQTSGMWNNVSNAVTKR